MRVENIEITGLEDLHSFFVDFYNDTNNSQFQNIKFEDHLGFLYNMVNIVFTVDATLPEIFLLKKFYGNENVVFNYKDIYIDEQATKMLEHIYENGYAEDHIPLSYFRGQSCYLSLTGPILDRLFIVESTYSMGGNVNKIVINGYNNFILNITDNEIIDEKSHKWKRSIAKYRPQIESAINDALIKLFYFQANSIVEKIDLASDYGIEKMILNASLQNKKFNPISISDKKKFVSLIGKSSEELLNEINDKLKKDNLEDSYEKYLKTKDTCMEIAIESSIGTFLLLNIILNNNYVTNNAPFIKLINEENRRIDNKKKFPGLLFDRFQILDSSKNKIRYILKIPFIDEEKYIFKISEEFENYYSQLDNSKAYPNLNIKFFKETSSILRKIHLILISFYNQIFS